MQSHLFEDELTDGPFDPHWQEFIPRQLVVRPLSDCSAQIRVVARQEELKEVVVIE